jgi:HSP20 family molecular chaperone IbpA
MACFTAAPHASPNTATFFPQFPVADLASFLQALDDSIASPASRPIRTFQPRFDVREEKDSFKLNGELPGVEQKDISIEFVDPDTLVIRGRSVRRESKVAVAADNKASSEKEIEAAAATSDTASETGSTYQKPSVEEDFVDVPSENNGTVTPATTAAKAEKPAPKQTEKPKAEPIKYLVSERAVGEFNRRFTFPGHVDQEGVTASLKNGILSVVVPKVVQKEPKKIVIQ